MVSPVISLSDSRILLLIDPAAIGNQYNSLARILLLVHDPTIPTVGPLRRTAMERVDVSDCPYQNCHSTANKKIYSRRKLRQRYGRCVVSACPTRLHRLRSSRLAWPSIHVSTMDCVYNKHGLMRYRRRSIHRQAAAESTDGGPGPDRRVAWLADACDTGAAARDVGMELTRKQYFSSVLTCYRMDITNCILQTTV